MQDDQYNNENKKGYWNNITSFLKWFGRNRRIQILFLVLAFALPVFLIIYGIILPVKNFKPYPEPVINDDGIKDTLPAGTIRLNDAQTQLVQEIIRKENEKVFQKNRLALAQKDSIYMVLNIPDSLLILEIKGVTVKKAKLLDFDISNKFSLISHENLLPWMSVPFSLERELSTIPKSPIVIKQAPKDTAEAARISTKPAPPDSTNVFFTLYFNRNLVLEIEQADPLNEGYTEKVKQYRSIKRKESTRSVFQMLWRPQQTNQPMRIKLWVSEVEARAIYRAVPASTYLLLKL